MKREKPKTMRITEAQKLLGVSYATAWKMARGGDLPTVTIGARLFILREPFEKMLTDPKKPAA